MSMRHMSVMRRVGTVALLSSSLVFALVACGGGGEEKDSGRSPSSAPATSGGDKGSSAARAAPSAPSDPIATVKGEKGIEMSVVQARRDTGGFLTVEGSFKNATSNGFSVPVSWMGTEQAVASTGNSLAAMTLVDSKGKKRYYVLRDTDNRPLTTYGYSSFIKAGDSLPFFAQFPAPPATTTQVALQFPGFPSTTIELS